MKIFLSFFLVLISFMLCINISFAQPAGNPPEKPAGNPSPEKLDNPLGTESVETLIGRIIKAILGVVGSLALLMFVYGGLTWMTASGNKEKVEKGKEIIIWATLGLVVIFSSYVLVEFVINALTTE